LSAGAVTRHPPRFAINDSYVDPVSNSGSRPSRAVRPAGRVVARTAAPLGLQPFGQSPVRFVQSTARRAG